MKKLNVVTLSGLIIGPILGSGIIILPPAIHQVAGSWSFLAWLMMVLMGFAFAAVFGALSIRFPGDAGVANAVNRAFGPAIKQLTSYYLIGAVVFGPVAVLLTAGEYFPFLKHISAEGISVFILFLCFLVMLRRVSFMGTVSLIVSTLTVIILFTGSIASLAESVPAEIVTTTFTVDAFGHALLLLFWTMVGWEVIGNYSADVENPDKTIPKTVIIGASIIGLVSLTVAAAAAVQWGVPEMASPITVTLLIEPLFHENSEWIMGMIVLALCSTTYLLFTGGVARLIASIADEKKLPQLFAIRLGNRAPVGALTLLGLTHCAILYSVNLGWFDVPKLVALANGFFLANAAIGLMTAARILESKTLRILAVLLVFVCLAILLFSHWLVLMIIAAMGAPIIINQQIPRPA